MNLTIYKFGTIGKKTIELDGNILSLKGAIGKKTEIGINEIKLAYITPASISKNGTVYFSLDGNNSKSAAIDKLGFMYTKGQLKSVKELISESDIEAIYTDSPESIKKTRITVKLVSGKEQIGSKKDTVALVELEPGIVSVNTRQYKFMGFDWGEQKYRSGGKAVAGAVIGGVLTGGIGALAGAALGGKRRDASKATMHLTDRGTNKPVQLIIECDEKKANELGELTMYFE